MRLLALFISLFLFMQGMILKSFREEQMNYTRVREAYADKGKQIVNTLNVNSISRDSLRIYLCVFKTEKKLELWAKNSADTAYILIKTYPICELSGTVGPKRQVRDLQVPEGFYRISDLNPYSKYYLSMQINYPNASDSIRGVHNRLGNYIFIHGECVSSGCIAITNEMIKELYIYCIEAYNSGQQEINISIYPARLNDDNYLRLTSHFSNDRDKISLWADLKKSYDLFLKNHVPPTIKFLPDGTHEVN
jgi:murein L,D-transpeptidase YafK